MSSVEELPQSSYNVQMKIHPPRAIIENEEPFKNALFGRKEFAESLTTLLRNFSENHVIFVNAPWGEGKTTFAHMWRTYLNEGQKLEVVYFDAYAADYFEDPFISFSGEILALVKKRFSEGKGLLAQREFKKTAVEVGKRLAGLVTKIGLRVATMNALDSTHLKEIKEIGSDIASGVSEIAGDVIEEKIENYTDEKDALATFKKSLAKLAAVVREEQGFPLTIIVDELDRCRPDFALGLLERIKHLFDVEGIAFVLLVNREQIESYIQTVYGELVDSRAYLLKFATLFVDLPNQSEIFSDQHVKGRSDYCQILSQHHDLKTARDPGFVSQSVSGLADLFNMTLREIEKVFTGLALYYGSRPAHESSEDFLISLLAVLKVKRPPLYIRLSSGEVGITEFFKETALDRLKENSRLHRNQEYIKTVLDFCLMSDMEYKTAINLEGPQSRFDSMLYVFGHRPNRDKIIPFFCSRLNRFSMLPE